MKRLIKQVDGFDIYFEALPEHEYPGDHFPEGTPGELKDMLMRINNGLLTWFRARVTVEKADIELGADMLGCCLYDTTDDFINEEGGYFNDMVENAIKDAKTVLPELIKKLQA